MIALLTGDHPRHKYLADSFSKTFDNVIWIIQKREKFVPEIDKNFNHEIRKLQKIHFEKRSAAENKFFSSTAGDITKNKNNQMFEINKEDISNGSLKKILLKINFKFLISYGVQKIPDNILNDLKGYKWNIHGGLSPWYRGSITHFWPSYMLEPEYTGMTLHETTKDIDGGRIIHQTISELNIQDGIHENACRVVKNFSDSLLIGHSTTGSLSSAEDNTGVGIEALDALTSGDQNTAVGNVALTALTSSGKNTGVGAFALNVVTDSTGFNSAFGRSALQLVTGSYNTGVGTGAGENITSGSGNVIIGKVLADSATGSRQLKIAGYDGSTTTTWITGDSSGNVTVSGTVTANGETLSAGVSAGFAVAMAIAL